MSEARLLTAVGMVLLLLALVEAWLLVMTRYMGITLLQKVFRSDKDLLRSHIDFLLMAILLFCFSRLQIAAPAPLFWLCCIGGFTNPILFLIMSVRPDVSRHPMSPFGVFSAVSFTITTVGFGGLAVISLLANL